METGNLWDHFKLSAVATLNTCEHDVEIHTARPDLTQYGKAFE